jgi:elongation factor G
MFEVLGKVAEEDPTFRFEEDAETGQRIVKGMGELHLQITFERVEREFGLKLVVGRPRVVSRESISRPARATGEVDRTIEAGNHQLHLRGAVTVSVEPRGRGEGLEVLGEPVFSPAGMEPTADQRAAVLAGARDALSGGPLEGAVLEDVRVRLEQVTLHPEGSTANALRIAAATAVREALQKASPVLLQPIMKMEVVVPDENTGTVLGDLQARGAVILDTQADQGLTTVTAECGLGKLIGYMTDLRSNTRGRGQFVMEFNRFDAL